MGQLVCFADGWHRLSDDLMKMRSFVLLITAMIGLGSLAFGQKSWEVLPTEPYPGKQDDIYMLDHRQGWYVNGSGKIYRTQNGGDSWQLLAHKPGTFFRCVAFADSLRGWVGNVGTDYFPGVTDTIPLYQTTDGGKNWLPVAYKGPYVKGLCAIDLTETPFVNHGTLGKKLRVFGVGRVGSPAMQLVSEDGGKTFVSQTVPSSQMLFDVKMLSPKIGVACGATDADISQSHGSMLRTTDGGKSWQETYRSPRPYEITWKTWVCPDQMTLYATLQSYNPDTSVSQQYYLKSIDGGKSWQEYPLVRKHGARSFGLGFLDEKQGYIGTMTGGYGTSDGGNSWQPVALGRAANKFRLVSLPDGSKRMYAIGLQVFRLDIDRPTRKGH